MQQGERVFVVARDDFFNGDWPHGFVTLAGDSGAALIDAFERKGFFAEREVAEQRPAWKQLIPYCIVTRSDEVFCVQRTRQQSEGRLHGLWSIGLGGHINPVDGDERGIVHTALERELAEELHILGTGNPLPQFLGLLNDDTTDVGRVHTGLVYRLDVPAGTQVRIREIAKMHGHFRGLFPRGVSASRTPARVVETPSLWQDSAFESWSTIMLESGVWDHSRDSDEGSRSGAADREESHNG